MTTEVALKNLTEGLTPKDRELVERAYQVAEQAHAGQLRATGEPYFVHSLAVASMLAELRLDPQAVAASLLHDVPEDTSVTLEHIREQFGDEVARLVDGVTKLGQIDAMAGEHAVPTDEARAENLRKMFLAMVDDVRVVLIKLADRLHNMRTLGALSEEKRALIARETLDIFAPLANRLGFWRLKWELEDLSFRYLEPERYRQIAAMVAARRGDREDEVEAVAAQIQAKLAEAGIQAEVTGRPKHIYSIYRKMNRKGVDFDQIYDIRGLRIIVETVKDCYAALGIVHSVWRPIPGEFDDYIATPKDNLYQSLHTAMLTNDGKPLEVQIRTREMHEAAELGIAAHWRYKESARRDLAFERKLAWLRSLMDWRQDVASASEFMESVRTEVFQDRVYVFTPKGEVIDLPAGSTPIDFAYQIHSQIGDRCRGAKVNGKLVSLDYQLQTGDRVEILTAKRGGPSRDWLNPHLDYVKTSRAQQKIRQWFKRQDRAQNVAEGRDMVDRELKRLGLEKVKYEELAHRFDYDKTEDFFEAIGYGDVSTQQIASRAQEIEPEGREPELPPAEVARPPVVSTEGITVRGAGNLLTHIAKCCHPLPGDEIVGYITRGRGVTIHRKDCPNILSRNDHDRLIEVEWGRRKRETYPVVIRVTAYDRGGLLRDIASVVSDEDVNMSSVNVQTLKKDNLTLFTATLEISDITQLSRVLARIYSLPNVLEARRQSA